MAQRDLTVRLIGDSRSLERAFTRSSKAGTTFATQMKGITRSTGGFSRGFLSGAGALSSFGGALALTSGSFFAGAGLIAGLKGAVTAAADFQQTMNVLQQVSHATAVEMAAASDEARKLGADISLPATSATDAAQAMQQLAKGGLSIQQALAGARGTLQLAAAAQTDVATAANTTARALTAFGLSGENAGNIADALANAANSATGDIVDFAIGLSQSATSAHQFGLTAEDTVTALTELAKAGLVGSDAGTSLRVMLGRLLPTSKAAREEMKKLGVHVSDAKGQFLPFRNIIDQYAKSLAKLPSAQRQQALQTIFGTDAQRAANIILQAGVKNYDELHRQVSRQGGAARAAAAQQKGFNGAMDGFNSALNTTAVNLGTVILPKLTEYLRSASTWLSDTKNQERLQRDFNQAFQATAGVLKAVSDAVKTVDKVTGSLKNTFMLLLGLKVASTLRKTSTQLLATKVAAEAASGKTVTLAAKLAELGRIGVLSVAFRFPGLATGLASLAELSALASVGMVIPVTVAFAVDRSGLNTFVPDLLKQISSLGGKGSLTDRVENVLFGSPGNRGFLGNLLAKPHEGLKASNEGFQISAAKVAKETTDFNKRVARKAEETISKNPVVVDAAKGLKITAAQRNTFFDNAISRILLRGGLGDLQQQLAATLKASSLISARIKVTKDITRKLNLEDQLLQLGAQARDIRGQIGDAARERAQAQREKLKARADRLKEIASIRLAQRTARQFRELGLSATGDEVTPGVANLRKRLGQLTGSIAGTRLDTPKLQSQLARFRKVLSEGLVPKDVRAKIKQMMDDIADELKQSGGRNQTKFRHASSNAILAGLGLTPDQTRLLRSRLSQIGAGGTVPGARSLAFSGAGANNPIVVNSYLDGKLVASNTTAHQRKANKRRSYARRGSYAGHH